MASVPGVSCRAWTCSQLSKYAQHSRAAMILAGPPCHGTLVPGSHAQPSCAAALRPGRSSLKAPPLEDRAPALRSFLGRGSLPLQRLPVVSRAPCSRDDRTTLTLPSRTSPASQLRAASSSSTAPVDAPPSTPSFVDGDLRYASPAASSASVSGEVSASGREGEGEDWGWDQSQSDIIFVGTGTSEGVPRVSCLTDPAQKCKVCTSAALPGNKNRRRNTSLLVRYSPPGTAADAGSEDSGHRRNILIDAGKFFYHSAMQWFPKFRVRHLDAVVITHSHADAIGGLDCLRDWTNNVESTNIPIYVAERDLKVMQSTHYYLVDTSRVTPGTAVSQLQFEVISTAPFYVHGLKFTPLPVWHGPGYLSFGFRFGNVCYISDVSEIPETTYPLLQNCDLLIMDALRPDKSSTTHFGLPAALAEVRKIKPKRTLFTGMMHNMDHEPVNEMLARLKADEGIDCSLSYDGLRLPVDLS